MRNSPTRRATVIATLLLAATLTGCAAQTASPDAAPTPAASEAASVGTEGERLLAGYGLDGMDAAGVIDHLDGLGDAERPDDLVASVRPAELVLSAGTEELNLDLPEDRFYLSVAPYVDQTHECFHHSLTTCKGELASTDVQVEVVDALSDKVLVDETRTTFDNGFIGFWLPRDIEGTLRVTYDGRSGEVDFATDEDSPTCLTTVKLV